MLDDVYRTLLYKNYTRQFALAGLKLLCLTQVLVQCPMSVLRMQIFGTQNTDGVLGSVPNKLNC